MIVGFGVAILPHLSHLPHLDLESYAFDCNLVLIGVLITAIGGFIVAIGRSVLSFNP